MSFRRIWKKCWSDFTRKVGFIANNDFARYKKLLDNIRGRCTPQDMFRVSRIFEWLLFAERKGHIQKYEVLLGSSLHEGCMALERDSKPFSNALDICKPLIEDGPGGTIALIHSTLPSYVFSSLTTPTQLSKTRKGIGKKHL